MSEDPHNYSKGFDNQNKSETVSAFDEVKNLSTKEAISVLIQASNLAQKAGALTIRDSIFLGASIEILEKEFLR